MNTAAVITVVWVLVALPLAVFIDRFIDAGSRPFHGEEESWPSDRNHRNDR